MTQIDFTLPPREMSDKQCPLSLTWARDMLNIMKAGECIEVLTTDPMVFERFNQFIRHAGHELVTWSEIRGLITMIVRKGNG